MNKINIKQIDMPNDCALDLLIQNSEGKQELVDILKTFKIDCNTSDYTLKQLINKVNEINTVHTQKSIESLVIGEGIKNQNINHWIIENNFIFTVSKEGNLYYKKLKTLFQNIVNYNQNYNTDMNVKTNFCDAINTTERRICFSEDHQVLFVWNKNYIYKYKLKWNDEDIEFSEPIKITPLDENQYSVIIRFMGINYINNQLIIQTHNNGVLILDAFNIDKHITVNCENLKINNNADYKWYYVNNKLVSFNIYGNKLEFRTYKKVNNKYEQDEYITFDKEIDDISKGILQYTDRNNRSILIYHNHDKGYNTNSPSFLIYNGEEAKCYYCHISSNQENNKNCQSFNVYYKNYKYYILAGSSLLIFDKDWNLLGNATYKCLDYISNLNNTLIYNNDIYSLGENLSTILKTKCWFDKNIVYSKLISYNHKQKEAVYFANVKKQDLEDGFYAK